MVYSLTGKRLGQRDEKYEITIHPPVLSREYDIDKVNLDSGRGKELDNFIMMPLITMDMWNVN